MRHCAQCGTPQLSSLDGGFIDRRWLCSSDCEIDFRAGRFQVPTVQAHQPSAYLRWLLVKCAKGSKPAQRNLELLHGLSADVNAFIVRHESVDSTLSWSGWDKLNDDDLRRIDLIQQQRHRVATPIANAMVRDFFQELPTWMYVSLDRMEEKTGDAIRPLHTPEGDELLGSPTEKRDDEAA